jgi:hypothetical protein
LLDAFQGGTQGDAVYSGDERMIEGGFQPVAADNCDAFDGDHAASGIEIATRDDRYFCLSRKAFHDSLGARRHACFAGMRNYRREGAIEVGGDKQRPPSGGQSLELFDCIQS